MPDTHLILHVKGTEQETTSLPRQVVRAAISQGQITHSQLIWSTIDNAWKQVRELPQLLPSQKLAPAPVPRVATGTLPKVVATPQPQVAATPRVAVAKSVAAGMPVARAASGQAPMAVRAVPAKVASPNDLVVQEEHGIHPLKWLCIGVGILVLFLVGMNYLVVDRPFTSRMGTTSYSNVPVYAHLGAFMQPSVIVIHIPGSASVTESNLSDFLVALARSTPDSPFGGGGYERVALTSGWTGQYSFSGYAWKQLGGMAQDDESQRKEFILEQMVNASGEPLISGNANLSDDARQAERENVWKRFVSQFAR